jgi:uncharacterized protein
VGRSEKGLGPRFLIRALGFHDDRNLGRARSGRGRSHRPLVPRPCGFGLGVAFLKAEFSYTASWRRFLARGEAGGLFGGLIVIAICACVVVPVAALSPKYGGAIAPLGPSLIIAAFVFFAVGMQLANGCGSGTLYTVGGGSGRMLVALSFFVIGSVLGSLRCRPSLPSAE